MKITSNTLEPLIEEWSDPGDYPNAVAQSALPSYDYLAGMEGELVLELTDDELIEMLHTLEDESLDFWMQEVVEYRLPSGILSASWQIDKMEGNVVTLSVTDVEGDPDWRDEPPEPDYYED